MNFTLSQTKLKQFEDGCPRKWKAYWLEGSIPFYTNEKMDRGSYFEYLCLGGGATDEEVTDLPRLKNGKKSKAHLRVESQAEKFKKLFSKEGEFSNHKIVDTQRVIWNEDKSERGVVDFVTVDKKDSTHYWDLKLTDNVDAKFHPKHWGLPDDEIDVTQAIFYMNMPNDGIKSFKFLIFDVTPSENVKLIEVNPTEEDFVNLSLRKIKMKNEIKENEMFGWPERPNKMDCSSCPLDCLSRIAEFKYG